MGARGGIGENYELNYLLIMVIDMQSKGENYVLLIDEVRKISDQIDQFAMGLIHLKEDLETLLSHFGLYHQKIEEEIRTNSTSYKRLIHRLLNILDDFNENMESIDSGFIKVRIQDAVNREGIVPITAKEGEVFNLEKHEIIDTILNDEVPEGTIVKVAKPGYMQKQNSKIIRKVGVIITNKKECGE